MKAVHNLTGIAEEPLLLPLWSQLAEMDRLAKFPASAAGPLFNVLEIAS